ncbi:OLC1v1008412C1 [Oldenlandia corymbosa var. corymbosa]|uniref:OLC1v1008412C1 n=1 Tax=Oldenlandia corymbosa var. corymbosa TaxID=529605 RepID=A0AAV1DLJ7_OLDCO|nr:OLC1v1008412C1 [Oldenlandia corymbosa var. corymbosa]
MSYFSRAWLAASVAVVNSHSDQGLNKLKSAQRGLQNSKKRFFAASGEGADFRPLAGVLGSDVEGGSYVSRGGDDQRNIKRTDESLRQVMYLSCWGPS